MDKNYTYDELAQLSFLERFLLANEKKYLEFFINDPHKVIRSTVAHHGYGLDVLINDPEPSVREAVLYNLYGLDVLAEDSDSKISILALIYLDIIEKLGFDKNNLSNEEKLLVMQKKHDVMIERAIKRKKRKSKSTSKNKNIKEIEK